MAKIMYGGIAYGTPVNEDYQWTDLTGTLIAGQTALTIQHSVITTDAVITVYTDTFGANPINVVITTGQAVLTFNSRALDLGVMIRISKTNDRVGGLWATDYTYTTSTYT